MELTSRPTESSGLRRSVGALSLLLGLLVLAPLTGAQALPEIRVSPNPLVFTEGQDTSITISLSEQPTDDVDVTINPQDLFICVSRDCFNVLTNRTQITIPADEWETGVTYRIGAEDIETDTDTEDNTGTIRFTAQRHQELSLGYTMLDDNRPYPEFEFSGSAGFELSEGGTAKIIGIGPGRPPGVPVRIYATSSDLGAVTVSPSSRYFASRSIANFTVTPVDDSDIQDENVTITFELRQSNGEELPGGNTSTQARVLVQDDETKGFVLPSETLEVSEGGSGRFNVQLSEAPTRGQVRVQINTPRGSDIALNRNELTFTAGNWMNDQAVSFRVRQDSDSDSELDIIQLIGVGGGYTDIVGEVRVQVQDDEEPQVTGMPAAARVDEGATLEVDTFRLSVRPTDDVTVKLASSDAERLTVSPETLEFTRSNWNIGQDVTLSALRDGDLEDDDVLVDVTASGAPGFVGVMGSFSVQIVDISSHTVSAVATGVSSMNEGEAGGSIAVRLNSRPTGPVEVRAEVPGYVGSDFTACAPGLVCQPAMTFTPSNWNTVQTFRILPNEDLDDQDFEAELMVTASGAEYTGSPAVPISVRITDNDRPGLTFSPGKISIDEGAGGSFTVRLRSRPVTQVSVKTAAGPSLVSVNPAYMVFSPDDWNRPRTVYVTARSDPDGYNENTSVTFTADGNRTSGGSDNPYQSVTDSFPIEVIDDEEARPGVGISLPAGRIWVEGDKLGVNVRLRSIPDTESVTVTLAVHSADASKISGATSSSATRSRDQWSEDLLLSLNLAQDADTTDDEVTVTVTTSGGNYEGFSETFTGIIYDDDANRLAVTPSDVRGEMNEGGDGVDYWVRLSSAPTAEVTVDVSSSDSGAATPSSDELTFTTADWDVPQKVTAAPVDDADSIIERGSITFAASDGGYDNATASWPFTVFDDEVGEPPTVTPPAPTAPTIELSMVGNEPFREGEQGTLRITLLTEPSRDTEFEVEGPNTDYFDSVEVTMTRTQWLAGTRYVDAVIDFKEEEEDGDDYDDYDLDDHTITLTVTGAQQGSNYNNVAKNIRVTVYDNDERDDDEDRITERRIIATPANGSGEIIEGGAPLEYGIRLIGDNNDERDVTVKLASSDTSAATVSPSELTFVFTSYGEWGDEVQTFTVMPVSDRDAEDDRGTIEFATESREFAFNDLRDANGDRFTVPFTVKDDEKPAELDFTVGLDRSSQGVVENNTLSGGTAIFRIKLSGRPSGSVSGTVTSTDTARLGNKSFNVQPNNWAGHNFDLSVLSDSDTDNNDVDFTVTLNGGGFDNYSKTFTVTIFDKDSDNLAVTPVTDSVLYEGGSTREFYVRMSRFSSGVSVNLTSSDTGAVTVSPSSLTLGSLQPAKFTVTSVADDDARDERVFINVTGSGGNYNNVTTRVPVTVLDSTTYQPEEEEKEEQLDINLSVEELLRGGQRGTVRINTTGRPTGPVTFTIDSRVVRVGLTDADGQSISSLTFQPDDYSADPNGGKTFGMTVSSIGTESGISQNVISVTANGGGFDNFTRGFEVNVLFPSNNETYRFRFVGGPNILAESGGGAQYKVIPMISLDDPDDLVPVDVTVDITAHSGATDAVTIHPTRLSFSATEWDTPKAFTVTPVIDSDGSDERLTLKARMNGYNSDTRGPFTDHPDFTNTYDITIKDDHTTDPTFTMTSDVMREIVTDTSDPDTIAGNIYVRLSDRPSGTVTFTPSFSTGSSLSASATTFTVAPNDWRSDNKFALHHGALDGNDTDDEVTITLTADGGGYDDLAKSFKLTVFDSTDYAIAAAPVDRYADAVEEGRPVHYAVRLTRAPATGETINVSVTSSDPNVAVDTDPDTAGNQATLAFAEAGDAWSDIQTVNVRALHDDNRNNEDVTITFSTSDGAYSGADDVALHLRVIDNEVIPGVISDAGLSDIDDISGDEGDRVARSVRLDVAPRGDVRLNLVSDNPDITFSSDAAGSSAITSLSFDGGNWDTAQTFYTSLGRDMDPVDDSATVSLLGSGGGYDGVSGSYSVSVDDGGTLPTTFLDFVEFTVGETLVLREGEKNRIGVRLKFPPNSGVRFTNERSSNGNVVGDYDFETEYSASGDDGALLFTRDNWNVYQYFSITPFVDLDSADDTDTLNLRLEDIPAVSTGQASGGGDIITLATGSSPLDIGADGSVTITDTVSASIVLAEDTLEVAEGEEAVFRVSLGAWDQIRGTDTKQVAVSGASGDTSAVSNSSNSLTFTSSNWNVPQELKFDTVEDADSDSEQVALTLTVSGGGYSSISTQATLSIRDNDTASLVLSESSVALDEGGAPRSVTVKLSSQPSDTVEIRLGSSDSRVVWVDADPATTGTQQDITFTPANWDTPQPFNLLAFDDADSVDQTASITLTATGGGYDGVTASIGVTVDDDEVAGLTLSPAVIAMNEGDVANLDVRLSAIPSSDVTVTLTLPRGAEDSLTSDLRELTFTPERWNVGQSFTLTALRDADFGDEKIMVALTNSGGGFTGTGGEAEVRISDENPELVLSRSDIRVSEGGKENFTVSLDRDPGADGTVFYVSKTADGEGRGQGIFFDTDPNTAGDQDRLTFTSANWQAPQTVEVGSTEDRNAVNETATLRLQSDNDLTAVEVAVRVQDANIAEMRGLPVVPVMVDEGGSVTISNLMLLSSPVVQVVVNFEPSIGKVIVDTDPGRPGSQSTMRFTPDDWQTPRSIVLTAGEDLDGLDDRLTVDLTASGDAFTALMGSFDVQITDDDPHGVSAVEAASGSAATLVEGASGVKIYDITLDTQPIGPVTVRPSVTHPDSIHFCRTTTPALSQCVDSLVFTPDNYTTAQQLVIGAKEDANGVDEDVTLTYTASGADYEGATLTSTSTDLTLDDNDVPGLTTVPEWGVLVDEGEVVEFTVVLDTQPTANMFVDFNERTRTAGLSAVGNPLPDSLDFTPSNWNIPQVMRVFTVINDSSVEDTTIQFTLEPFGGGYDLPQNREMTLIIADTSTPSRTLKEPITKSINPFVRTPVWSNSPGAVSAKLSERPSDAVTLTFAPKASADSDKVELANATIELHPLNWDEGDQMVTVTVKSNAISDHDTATLTVTAEGGGYDGVTAELEVPLTHTSSPDLVVSWPDPDKVYWERVSGDWVPYLQEGVSNNELTIGIGPSEAISGAGVTLTATITQNTGAADISFNNSTAGDSATATWDEDDGTDEILEFKVTPQTDTDTDDTQVQIRFSAQGSGSNFATAVTETVTINVKEVNVVATPETRRLSLSNKRVSGLEGLEVGSACSRCTLSVKLASQPTGQVSVTFSSDNPNISVVGADGTTVIDSLVFTASNWNTEQDYWVRVADDNDAEDQQTTLTLTASGGGYSGIVEEQIVEIYDNDDPSVTFFPGTASAPVTVDEDGVPRAFTIALNTRPLSPVSFTLDSSVSGEAGRFRMSPETVSFTQDNWNQPQAVSLVHLGDENAFNSTGLEVSLKATGGGKYQTQNSGLWSFVASSLNDPDRARIVTSPSIVSVYEGESVDVQFSLSHLCYSTSDQGNDDYWIRVSETKRGDDDNTAVRLATLRSGTATTPAIPYDTRNWSQPQILRITAPEDSDSDSEEIFVDLTGTQEDATPGCAGQRGGLTGQVKVLVVDNDAGALPYPSRSELNLEEGGAQGTLTLALSEQPQGFVRAVLSVRPEDAEKVEFDADRGTTGRQDEILFSTSDWSTPRTISVRPLQDEDINNEAVNLTVSASGGGVDASTVIQVNIEDDDEPSMILVPTEMIIDESVTDTFAVRLNAPPVTGNVNVTLVQPDLPSVTVDTNPNLAGNQNRISFTSSNWDDFQTVSVAVADDDNAFEETTSITLRAAGGGFNDSATVNVAIRNNDRRAFVIQPKTVEIAEGGSTEVMVTLASRPSGDVAFTMETSSDDLTASSTGSGTFTPANWNTPQSVTLSLAQDDNGFDEDATLTFRVSGSAAEYTDVLSEFSVYVSDDETAAVLTQVTGGAALTEGESETFGVKLASQPGGPGSGDVIVTPSCNNCSQLTFSPATLTFTQSNWDTWANFTINALDDGDSVDSNVEVAFSAEGRDYNQLAAILPFTVIDDEAPGVVFSETLVTLLEGSSEVGSTRVKLSQQPSGAVTLTFATAGINAVKLDTDADTAGEQNTLEFTTANWDTGQEVRLTPQTDFDVDDEEGMFDVTLQGGGYDTIRSRLRFVVEDDDVPSLACGIFEDPADATAKVRDCDASLTQGENAAGDVLTVRLASDPGQGVSVTVLLRASNPDVTFTDGTVQQTPLTSLTFNDGNWNVEQKFATAVAEDSDAANETAVITLSAASDRSNNPYNSVSSSYTLNITDDENGDIGITLSAGDAADSRLRVREGGSAQFGVRPDVPPTRPMTISLSPADSAKGYALAPAGLTFNSANYRHSKMFRISPPSDLDTLDEDVSVTLVMRGGEFDGVTQTLYLEVEDDESPGLLITPGELSVSEGLTQTFTVQLLAEPRIRPTSQGNSGSSSGYDVDVAITSGDTGAVQVLTPSLSFKASEWNVPKSVSLRGIEDANQLTESPTITLTTSATACSTCPTPDYDGVSRTVAVRTVDNDVPNVHLSDLLLDISETGSGTRFTVNLLNPPPLNDDVTVSVTSGDPGAVTVSPAQLTFTSRDWSQPATVIVRPVSDEDGSDERVTVTASGTGGGYLNTANTLTVVVRDEDPALLQLSKDRLLLQEGADATFAVSLSAAPVSRISVLLNSQDIGAVTVAPDILDFSPDDWNTLARTVTVTGESDSDALDEEVTVDLRATGEGYANVSIQLSVGIVDTGEAGLSLPDRVQIVEASDARFDVQLTSEPESPVTLTFAQPENPDVTLDTDEITPGDQNTMIFSDANWNVASSVKLTARDDGDTQDEPTSISVVASGGDYEGIFAGIDVSLIDDDRIRLLLVPDKDLGVAENDSSGSTLSVRLGSLPSGLVTVTPRVAAEGEGRLSVSPDSLTFDASNWQTTRDITVTAENDLDPVNESILLSLTTAGGGYDNRSESILVKITDDDVAELVIEPDQDPPTPPAQRGSSCPAASYCVYEDDSDGKAIRLKLSAQPSGDVTIQVTSSNEAAITVATETLTFTPGNWDEEDSATLLPVLDSNAFEEDVVVTLSASGGGFDGVVETVDVEAWERSEHGMIVTPPERSASSPPCPPAAAATRVCVPEGGSATFTVSLSAQPLFPALVTLAQPDAPFQIDTDLENDGLQNILQFSSGDWNDPQEVTVFAAKDANAFVEEDDIELTLLGSDYPEDGITASVTFRIDEAENIGIVVTGAPLTVHEGGGGGDDEDGKLQVRLLAKPTTDVTVDVENDQTARMTVLPASLTFNPDNWNVDQALTVSGVEDDDTDDHTNLSFDLKASGGEYTGFKLEDIAVIVIDNDQIDGADLVVSTNMLNILEGESAQFQVKLAVQPEGTVTVRVISMDTLAASVSPPQLKFTQENWNVDQTVTVTGVQDLFDLEDAETKIVFRATGGGYSGVGAGQDISVMIADAEGSEADVVKQVLAETGRSALIGTQEVIGRRLDAAPGLRTATLAGRKVSLSRQAGQDLASGFAGIAGGQKLGADRFDGFRFGHERHSMDWLGGIELRDGKPLRKAPELSTLGRSVPLLGNFTYDLSADRGVGWTLWGRLDQREFSGEMEASLPGETQKQSYESAQSSVWLGFDRRLVSGAVIGIAVSQSTGEGSYKVYQSMLDMETSVTNYLSYFELGLGAEGRLRVMLGSGSGDMTVTPSTGPTSTVNLTTVLGSLGFRWPLARVGQGRLVLTGSLGLSEVSTDEAVSQCSLNSCTRVDPQGLNHGAAISEIDAANNSARVGLQLEPRPWIFGTDWKLEPRIGMSLRQDSGDGIEGSGAELTSALKLNTPSERFSIDVGMQYLGTHSAAELSEEWGASLEFALHSIDDSGRGLSLSVGPQWGLRDTGLLERAEAFAVNDSAARRRSAAARRQAASLGAQLGYGLDTLGGMLTPFAEYNFTGGSYASSRQNLGVRFSTRDELEAKLFSEQQSVRGGDNTNGFGFEIRKTY